MTYDELKLCTICGEFKSFTEFYRYTRKSSSDEGECIDCLRQQFREEQHKAALRAQAAKPRRFDKSAVEQAIRDGKVVRLVPLKGDE